MSRVRPLIWLGIVGLTVAAIVWAVKDDGEQLYAMAEGELDAPAAGPTEPAAGDDALDAAARAAEPGTAIDDDEVPTLSMGDPVPSEALGRPESIVAPPEIDVSAAPAIDERAPATGERHEADAERREPARETTSRRDEAPRRSAALEEGRRLLAEGRSAEARFALSQALRSGRLGEAEAAEVRRTLTDINERLVLSPVIDPGDPFTIEYTVKSGDQLAKIVAQQGLQVDWRFIQRINGISQPSRIRVGQRLKLVTGPFHAVVVKDDFRLDLYMGDVPNIVYVRSFPVGLGERDSTPLGSFRVRPDSKLIDPEWVNPRTGQRFAADDPANPIGERWIGLEGTDEANRDLVGYGIHGTVEPDSIGREGSMGCIRMRDDDVEIVYETLVEAVSQVQIVRAY